MVKEILDKLNIEYKEIHEVPESYSSTVAKVKLDDDQLVIVKVPYSREKLFREKLMLDKLQGLLPVPQVLGFWKGDDEHVGALVLSYLEGQPIAGDIDASLAYDIGALLANLHQVSMNNFTLMEDPTQDWWQSISDKYLTWIEECKGILDTGLINQCLAKFNLLIKNQDAPDGPVLVHFDYRPGNILIHDNKIVGLIDFESARGGSADIDFNKVKLYIWDEFPHVKDNFIKGYESVRNLPSLDKALPLYRLFNGIGGLAWCVRRDKLDDPFYDENYLQVVEILES